MTVPPWHLGSDSDKPNRHQQEEDDMSITLCHQREDDSEARGSRWSAFT